MSSSCRASPFPRRGEATAIDKISASSRTTRDTMNPMRLRPAMARWATMLRSKSKRSNSPSLHPRWNEAPWSAAKARASPGRASDSTGSRANRRLTIPIIGGGGAPRLVAAGRGRGERMASSGRWPSALCGAAAPCQRDAARGRYAHAQPGEGARTGGDRDAVEIGEFDCGRAHHAGDERRYGLGVAARHGQRLAGGDPAVGVEHGGRAGLERGVDGKDAHGLTFAAVDRDLGWVNADARISQPLFARLNASADRSPAGSCHRPDFDHVWPIMAQQVLDAVTQRRGRRRATRAGTLHVEIDNAVLEAAESDVAAVVSDGRPHSRLDQLFDGGNGFGIFRLEELLAFIRWGSIRAVHDRSARHEVFHDGAEDRGLELLPFAGGLGDGDEIRAEKYPGDPRDLE